MAKIYLHVGPHKTGSTYLQKVFSDQAKSLEKQGILYPITGRYDADKHIRSTGHHAIAWHFINRPLAKHKQSQMSAELKSLAKEQRDILLSSEEFSKVKETQLEALRESFPNHSFHTLYFVRKGAAFIISLWQESIKNGWTIPLDQASCETMAGIRKYDPLNHEENIARYKQYLGEVVSVFDYNEMMKNKIDITRAIAETLNVTIKSKNKQINPSLSMDIIELMRAANLYNAELGRPRRNIPRIACHRALKVPFVGMGLKHHVKTKFANLHKTLHPQAFLNMGYQRSSFLEGDMISSQDYIPGTMLLDELNKDNSLPWRIIKKMIQQN